MPICWIVCPLIKHSTGEWAPKIYRMEDPGRALVPVFEPDPGEPTIEQPTYAFAMSDSDTKPGWCACFVRGVDFTPLEADSEIFLIAGPGVKWEDSDKWLDKTLRQSFPLGQEIARNTHHGNLRAIAAQRGVRLNKMTIDIPLHEIVTEFGQHFKAGWAGPRGNWVK